MTTSLSFDIDTELVMSEEDGITALTKELNPWQRFQTSCMRNIKLKLITFTYSSRVSELAEGTVVASVIDNTIVDDGVSMNVLRSLSFDVKSDVYLKWSHDVSLHVNDLKVNGDAPIVLRTEITNCTVKPGYSLGNIKVHVEMGLSNRMFKRIAGQAFAKITPRKITGLNKSVDFPLRHAKDPDVAKPNTIALPKKRYVIKNPSDE